MADIVLRNDAVVVAQDYASQLRGIRKQRKVLVACQIFLRKKNEAKHRYIQTLRRSRIPAVGEVVTVRDIDGAKILASVTKVAELNGYERQRYDVEVEAQDVVANNPSRALPPARRRLRRAAIKPTTRTT